MLSAAHCDGGAVTVSYHDRSYWRARSHFKQGLDTLTDSSEMDVTMSDDQTLKKARGGTKSCTECK